MSKADDGLSQFTIEVEAAGFTRMLTVWARDRASAMVRAHAVSRKMSTREDHRGVANRLGR